MRHYWSLDNVQLKDSWLTIGSFDGVHRGHQKIIKELIAGAHKNNNPGVVLTFHPHPAVVLSDRDFPFYLTTPEERAKLLGDMGVDVIVTHPFNDEVRSTSARNFMKLYKPT